MKCRIKNCNHWKHYKHHKQSGEFLNRYYFAYAGRDTANTAILSLNRITPGLIKKTGSQIDQVAQRRIQQAINQGGKEIERVAPRLIKGGIKEFYKNRFRLLGQFERRKCTQVKRKVIKIFKNAK